MKHTLTLEIRTRVIRRPARDTAQIYIFIEVFVAEKQTQNFWRDVHVNREQVTK
jgi:hypothetical protein